MTTFLVNRLLKQNLLNSSNIQNIFRKSFFSTVSVNYNSKDLAPLKYEQYKEKEVTLYIKGFLSKGESGEDFSKWEQAHKEVSEINDRWEKDGVIKGWNWNSGKIQYPYPIFLGTNLFYHLYRSSKVARMTPGGVAVSLSLDASIYSFRIFYQYYDIESRMNLLSENLKKDIIRLSKKYKRVRIVCHSLGSKLLLNALKDVPDEFKPDCIHMCAPAITQDEFDFYLKKFNEKLAKEKTYIYYSENDYVLSVFYRIIKGYIKQEDIVGVKGLDKSLLEKNKIYQLEQKDCTSLFKDYWLTHNNYVSIFPKIIEENIRKKETN